MIKTSDFYKVADVSVAVVTIIVIIMKNVKLNVCSMHVGLTGLLSVSVCSTEKPFSLP